MAIQVINEPTFGGRLGEALGTGIGSGLETLAKMRMQRLAQREIAKGLEASRKERQEYNKYLADKLKFLHEKLQFQKEKFAKQSKLAVRKKVVKKLIAGKQSPEEIYSELEDQGYKPAEIMVFMGGELTEPIAQYFMDMAKGNKKKARALAKKYKYVF